MIDKATEHYNKVIEVCPDYSWAYYNLGYIYFKKGDKTKAKKFIEQTLILNPKHVDAAKTLAMIEISEGKLNDAYNTIKNAISFNKENGDLYFNLAQIHKKLGNEEKMISCLKYAIKYRENLTYSIDIIKEELKNFQNRGK